MKKNIHPSYREVVFLDTSNNEQFIIPSTVQTKAEITLKKKTYPLVRIEISSSSHPLYTGKRMFVDTAGRIEKFKKKYKK